MAGLGYLQANASVFVLRFQSCTVKNGRFTPLKCTKKTIDLKIGDGRRVLTIQEVPYVDEVVKKLAQNRDAFRNTESDLEEAYEKCRMFCAERDKLFFKATQAYTVDRQRALWALHCWARRIDDLVDSNKDKNVRSENLNQWKKRTNDILNGRPHDILDVALVDSLSKYPIDNTLFEDGIRGMRMDIIKNRYANFEELFLYCYYVAGTLGLMIFQVLGISPEATLSSKIIYDGAIYFGIALQLTNILNDVSDDARLGRVYLPQDELVQFGICEDDILSGKVSDGWREFMIKQVQRTRSYYDMAEQGVSQLDKASRTRMLSIMMVGGHVLDIIEERDYDNLTRKVEESFTAI